MGLLNTKYNSYIKILDDGTVEFYNNYLQRVLEKEVGITYQEVVDKYQALFKKAYKPVQTFITKHKIKINSQEDIDNTLAKFPELNSLVAEANNISAEQQKFTEAYADGNNLVKLPIMSTYIPKVSNLIVKKSATIKVPFPEDCKTLEDKYNYAKQTKMFGPHKFTDF